jgi:predicted nicotinamide N-methyase
VKTLFEEKYTLELMPIAIGGKKLELYNIADWTGIIDRLAAEGESYVEKFPFWVKTWESSIVLADHLLRLGLPKDANILELGAGMGVVGLFLGASGYHVTITDYEEDALGLLRKNVRHNGLDTVSVERLDWNNPGLTKTYDIICGSELIYKDTFIPPIIALFRKYLQPDGTIFLAHDVRRRCLMQFVGMMPGRFEVENIVKTMKSGDEVHRITIHRLSPKL